MIECFSWEKASGIRLAENGNMYDSLNDDRKLPNTYSNLKNAFLGRKLQRSFLVRVDTFQVHLLGQ